MRNSGVITIATESEEITGVCHPSSFMPCGFCTGGQTREVIGKVATGKGLRELLKYFGIERPRITEKTGRIQYKLFNAAQCAKASNIEEPCAAIPHAGGCEGAVG